LDRAETAYARLVQSDADDPSLWNAYGILAMQTNRLDEAAERFGKAVSLAPNAKHRRNLAACLDKLGAYAEATDQLRAVLAEEPQDFDGWVTLARCFSEIRSYDDALAALENAERLRSGQADVLASRADLLFRTRRYEEAVGACRSVLEAAPDHLGALINLSNSLAGLQRYDEAVGVMEKAVTLAPLDRTANSKLLFFLNYAADRTPEQIFQVHKAWGDRLQQSIAALPSNPQRTAKPKLSVGYVSADFSAHSVARFIEPVLQQHDRSKVEVFCYSNVAAPDATTERLKGLADCWRDIARLSDDEAADVIRKDAIDVLIDLSGHTTGHRLEVFARRPAPVQITWLGYPNTTGLPAMDYRVADPMTDPAGPGDGLCTEKLLRLDPGFLTFRPDPETPAPAAPPFVSNGYVTFGSFNNTDKLTDAVIALWVAVVQATPESKLMIKNLKLARERERETLQARFIEAGLAPDRLILKPGLKSVADHLAAYGEIDIALDPFPYNGTTTTMEALWMGVPMIALLGACHAGRVSASLLHQVGLGDLVAKSETSYVEISAALAQDGGRLTALRQTLRPAIMNVPLGDAAAFTALLEEALEKAWREKVLA